MREILFRGKRVENGEWVYGSYTFEPRRKGAFGQTISELDRKRHYIVSKKNYEFWEVIPETVGQYTELTDKNGKKIFEGDVIETSGLGYKQRRYPVVFCDGYFGFESKNDIIALEDSEYAIRQENREVIGNMHDNRALLEVEE